MAAGQAAPAALSLAGIHTLSCLCPCLPPCRPPQVLQQLGLEGVLVLDVPEGSPAAAAGMRPTYRERSGAIVLGDVIVGMDGKRVRSYKVGIPGLSRMRHGVCA